MVPKHITLSLQKAQIDQINSNIPTPLHPLVLITHVITMKYDRRGLSRSEPLFQCRARTRGVLVARVPVPEQRPNVCWRSQRDSIRQDLSTIGLKYSTSPWNATNSFSRGQLDSSGKLLSQSRWWCHYLVLYYRSRYSLWVLSDTPLL